MPTLIICQDAPDAPTLRKTYLQPHFDYITSIIELVSPDLLKPHRKVPILKPLCGCRRRAVPRSMAAVLSTPRTISQSQKNYFLTTLTTWTASTKVIPSVHSPPPLANGSAVQCG